VAEGLKKFAGGLSSPAVIKIGWEFKPDEDYLTVQLRKLLIAMSGLAGDERYAISNTRLSCSVPVNRIV
jgi:hypothetical protein